jgi:hypothetical protein
MKSEIPAYYIEIKRINRRMKLMEDLYRWEHFIFEMNQEFDRNSKLSRKDSFKSQYSFAKHRVSRLTKILEALND